MRPKIFEGIRDNIYYDCHLLLLGPAAGLDAGDGDLGGGLEVDDEVDLHVEVGVGVEEAVPGVQHGQLAAGQHRGQVLHEAGAGAVQAALHHLYIRR